MSSQAAATAQSITPPDAPPDAEAYRVRRGSEELYERSKRGSLFYAFSYTLVDAAAGYHRISWWLYALPIAVFVASVGARTRHRAPGPDARVDAHRRWGRAHWILVDVGLLVWRLVVAAVGWHEARLDAPVMIAVVCTVAHSTALSHAYGMSPGPAAVGLVALVGPGVGTFFVPGLGLWPAGVLLSVYFLYLLGTLGQSAQDFDRRVRMETNLLDAASKEQRAQASRESAMRLRQRILDTIPIPVFYKDAARAYLGCNDAHARFLGVTRDAVVGKTVHDLSPPELARIYDERDLELLRQPGSQVYEAEVDCRPLGEKRLVVFHKATFEATGGGVGGIVGALVDVTERTRAERHREEMIAELRLALEKVRKLSGLLPICANCKKIRDDKGYWNQIESYIHAHSEAEFSHGICPDCLEKLYPDLDDVDAG